MAPEERQAALIAATVPLLRTHGLAVSTRQIADAAGVAEGTIFRVFPDKASLLRAAVISAFDPEPLLTALAGIDRGGDLRARLSAVVELLRHVLAANAPLIAATRAVSSTPDDAKEFVDRLQQGRQRIMAGIAAVIEPDQALLRRDADSAAHLLLMMVMATVHSGFGEPNALSDLDSDEIASLLLDGMLVRPAAEHPSSHFTPTGDPI